MKKLFIHMIILLTLLLQALSGIVFAASVDEQVIKAAMVRNFARFTEWPENSHAKTQGETINLCVMASSAVEQAFKGLEGKKIGNRSIRLSLVPQTVDIKGCDILYVDKTSSSDMSRIMNAVSKTPILTVGETKQFKDAGGIITFFNKGDKIAFQINLEAARKAELKISSRLSELAVIVKEASGEKDK